MGLLDRRCGRRRPYLPRRAPSTRFDSLQRAAYASRAQGGSDMWRNDWKPYIGITDFTTADEMQEMFRVFQEAGGPAIGRVLQAGVMTSKKVLTDQPTSWAKAFPPKEKLREIFLHHEHLLGTLHYADYDEAPDLE